MATKELQLEKLLRSLPPELQEKDEYDLVLVVSAIADTYDLTFGETDELFGETYELFAGKYDTSLLTKRIRALLSEDNKGQAEKISKDILEKAFKPLKTALGKNFPVRVKLEEPSSSPSVQKDILSRDNILKEIENPERFIPRKITQTLEIEAPHEKLQTTNNLQQVANAPKISFGNVQKPESIAEMKMRQSVVMPKKEETKQSINTQKPTKQYTTDPYREPPK